MLKMTRREAFEIDISFDDDPSALLDLGITFVQDGRTVLCKGVEEVYKDGEIYGAVCTLSGEETMRFRAGRPVLVQAEAILADGEALHSNVAEISVTDVLGIENAAWRKKIWK